MDENYKRSTKARHLRQIAKQRTREEQKLIRELSRQRRAEAGGKGGNRGRKRRARDYEEGGNEEEPGFERMLTARERPPLPRGPLRSSSPARHDEADDATHDITGAGALVVAVARGRARVRLDGEELELTLAGELARSQQGAIAVGDRALIEELAPGARRIRAVLPRRSVLARPAPADPRRELVLAANVDLGVIVVTAERGAPNLGLIDRFLAALQLGGVGAAVCVNKYDLIGTPDEREELVSALQPYRELGLALLLVSATSGAGLDELRAAVRGRTCVLVGQSGVGKSSLLNALDPGAARATRATRARDGKGRHTTTAASLSELADGTRLIDTPGIRAFGLWSMRREELMRCFPELGRLAPACRFKDCTHVHEPACKVRQAVEHGVVSRARYDSYARILASQQS